MEVWIRINSAKDRQIIINRDNVYEIFIGSGIDTELGYAIGGHWVYHWTGYHLPLNQWTYVVVTYNGTHSKAYVNGTNVETYNWGAYGEIGDSSNELRIGHRTDYTEGSPAFNGTIDEVRIYNRSLSPIEINQTRDNEHHTLGNLTSIVKDAESVEGSGSVWKQIRFDGTNFHGFINIQRFFIIVDDFGYIFQELVQECHDSSKTHAIFDLSRSNRLLFLLLFWRFLILINNLFFFVSVFSDIKHHLLFFSINSSIFLFVIFPQEFFEPFSFFSSRNKLKR